ncbi:cation diffusion facilitator family transporter [Halalkalibacterium halodurans]|uniref:cation diffusion facilitator family transporter n=1 Tax=Halalkalibacterium halodurans TaxID=86665 RepID=UPI002AAA19D5|nr:cation diffusion facilitator family transporter [Halalkalibacterium halodurans]MDY7220929.1 cation diffusion facilitator family transporter [Halalkalibacterium halodurans]MDY7240168.1 cation diffusion facilitator family transporter [Halalkalibacterium halodurans]MED3646498.1 cation diffusion facilitator family transporter [Halalkalibacterium halodurans]MED4082525.1 cation diffusion facilitator family transporter [Halalkalibacterium halodurans]MED4085770.1 cation diffusion facilitator family
MRSSVSVLYISISVIGAIIFSAVGIIWGLAIHSHMIIFDGIYSLISVVLSLFSLGATVFMMKDDRDKFPYGKGMVQALTLVIKHGVIALLCLFAFITAVGDLVDGGRHVVPIHGAAYSLLSTAGCAAIFFFLRRKAGANPLIKAETHQWLMDTCLSAAVFIGFAAAFLLAHTKFAFLVPYVDPLMVALSAGLFITLPVKQIVLNGKEMLEMAPNPELQQSIESHIHAIEEKYQIPESHVRMAKVGQTLFIDIYFIIDRTSCARNVKDLDDIRQQFHQSLRSLPYEPLVNMTFTHDRKWAIS